MFITMIIKVIKILLEHCLFLLITNLQGFFLLWFLLWWTKKLETEDQLLSGTEDCLRISTDICIVIKGQFLA